MTEKEENMIDVKSVVKIKGHDVTRDYVVSGEGVSGKSRKVSEITEKDTSTVVTKSSKLRGKDGQYITPTVASSTNSNDTSVNIERLDNMSDQEVDIETERNAHRAEERLESDFGIAYDDEDDVLGFASEHSNAIRMILGVADKVDDEHKRLEHLFTSLERLCRGKDERNAEERRREDGENSHIHQSRARLKGARGERRRRGGRAGEVAVAAAADSQNGREGRGGDAVATATRGSHVETRIL